MQKKVKDLMSGEKVCCKIYSGKNGIISRVTGKVVETKQQKHLQTRNMSYGEGTIIKLL